MKGMNTLYDLNWVTDRLAVGHAPFTVEQLEYLKNEGITSILNLCGEFEELHKIQAEFGFEVYYMPVEDEEAPQLKELEKALEWLDEAIYLGKKVLIHCRFGIGRTGTVLNAYLLRRGLGHKMAGKTLKPFKSKPANFYQWRAIRKYGKKSGRLTIREPSLEFRRVVDLAHFFNEYEALVREAEIRLRTGGITSHCGKENTHCCHTPIPLTLMEAVYLTNKINITLSKEERMDVIDRGVAVARQERNQARELGDKEFCLTGSGRACPLLEEGTCLIYPFRPLQCRTSDLPEKDKEEVWTARIHPELAWLSEELFLTFADRDKGPSLPVFPLPEVVSGKYVERLFRLLMLTTEGELL
ncbi:MAG: dual specificity protein phosphatase family protein [Desulfovibrionales bacterium]